MHITFNKFKTVISHCFDDFLFIEIDEHDELTLYDHNIKSNPKFVKLSYINVSLKKVLSLFSKNGENFSDIVKKCIKDETSEDITLFYPITNNKYEFKFVKFDKDSLFLGIRERKEGETSIEVQLEKELSKTILLFKDAQRIAHLGYWELDVENKNIWGTRETRKILALDLENPLLSLQKIKQIVSKQTLFDVKNLLDNNNGEPNFNLKIQIEDKKNGKVQHLIAEGDFEYNKANKVIRMFGVVRDITNKIDQELQLKRKLQIEKAISRISLGFIQTDDRNEALQKALEQTTLATNTDRAYLLLLDYHENPTELIQWNNPNVDPPYYFMQKKNAINELTKKILKTKEDFLFENEISKSSNLNIRSLHKKLNSKSLSIYKFKREGKVAFVLFTESTISTKQWDENDKYFLNIAGFLINNQIVEKDYANALMGSERKYKDLFNQMSNGFALFQPIRNSRYEISDLAFIEINRALIEILELAQKDIIGKKFNEIFSSIPSNWLGLLKDEFATDRIISFPYNKNKQEKFIEVAFFLTDNGLIAMIVKDMTEHKKLEENLRQAERLQVVGQLAGGIAHDFNNQLMGIMGYGSMLESLIDDEEQLDFLHLILNSAKRSSELTRKLLDFSRKGKFLSVPVNLNDIISETILMLKHTVNKKIKIRKYFRTEKSLVKGDPSQIQNVLLNIGLNACDSMPEGGSLSVYTSIINITSSNSEDLIYSVKDGRYFRIRFIDEGQGMSKETVKKIFEPFYTTKSNKKGTGMGLAAVFGSVKQHKGGIEVRSIPNQGTEFSILFPYDDTLKPIKIVELEPQTISTSGNGTILVLDDEELLVYMLEKMLRDEGYNVHSFQEPDEAIRFYKKNWKKVDLVMLDFIMPKKNGTEVFTEMKRINSKIQALLLSGYSPDVQIEKLTSKGILGFIQKPVDKNTIIKRVRKVLVD